jgi:hypothetical protein
MDQMKLKLLLFNAHSASLFFRPLCSGLLVRLSYLLLLVAVVLSTLLETLLHLH